MENRFAEQRQSPLRFVLRFEPPQIGHWASRFPYRNEAERQAEAVMIDAIGPATRAAGYYTKSQLMTVGDWKSPRSRPRREKNTEAFVEAVTRTALSTTSEQLRIEVLTLLNGVSWPTASVILHFSHPDRYPVLDYRALWSVGVANPPAYDFAFWFAYVTFCRDLAEQAHVDMRTLDRALWQYSKENQP